MITRLVQSDAYSIVVCRAATIRGNQSARPSRYFITPSSTLRHNYNCSRSCLRTCNATLKRGYPTYIISEPWGSSYTYVVTPSPRSLIQYNMYIFIFFLHPAGTQSTYSARVGQQKQLPYSTSRQHGMRFIANSPINTNIFIKSFVNMQSR